MEMQLRNSVRDADVKHLCVFSRIKKKLKLFRYYVEQNIIIRSREISQVQSLKTTEIGLILLRTAASQLNCNSL